MAHDQLREPAAGCDNAGDVIRDAACLVLVDRSLRSPRLLMGRRRNEQVFLPGKWVFPGGRVDDADRRPAAEAACGALPVWLQAFANAAIRELAEETGLVWPQQGERRLTPLARAITPPGRIRRYDTWFFIAEAKAGRALDGDGELLDLDWFSIECARQLDLPNITRLVLDDAAELLSYGLEYTPVSAPFYFADTEGFHRTMIMLGSAIPPP